MPSAHKTRTLMRAALLVFVMPAALRAQDMGDVRLDLHRPKEQTGVIWRVAGTTAWLRLARPVAMGTPVAFAAFSDGSDKLASGRIEWVSPVAPFDCYVTQIKATTTKHPVNDYDSAVATEALSGAKQKVGTRPVTDGYGVELAKGFFGRLNAAPAAPKDGAAEPVRALLTALQQRKDKTAQALARSVARALAPSSAKPTHSAPSATSKGKTSTTTAPDNDADNAEDVDFTRLAQSLRPFRRTVFADPIADYLRTRLQELTDEEPIILDAPDGAVRPPHTGNDPSAPVLVPARRP